MLDQFLNALRDVSGMGESVLRDVYGLLEALGYPLSTNDFWLAGFCLKHTEQEIKNACNISKVPEGLYTYAASWAVGMFLTSKMAILNLDTDALNFQAGVKRIREGDTEIEYAMETASSGEQRLKLFLSVLERERERLVTYRRLKW